MSDVPPQVTEAPAVAPPKEAETTPAAAPASTSEAKPVIKQEFPAAFDEPLPKLDNKTPEKVQELLTGAAKQVNFYFSDSNLHQDRYLFSLTCCNEPVYGWVPIKTIISFSRMRDPYQGLGVEFVAYALKQAISREGPDPLLAVSEDGQNVRRVRPMERDINGSWTRSVYVKGLGEEGSDKVAFQSQVLQYFEQFGQINAVRLRREDKEGGSKGGRGKGNFKGSVFVEFATTDETTAFLAKESIPKFVTDGDEMIKMSKQAYVDMKTQERIDKGLPVDTTRYPREDASETASTNGERGQGGGRGRGGAKGGRGAFGDKFNAFKEMEKIRKGLPANLALIPDEVAVVGKAMPITANTLKRSREDHGDEREAKRQAKTQPFEIEYLGTSLKCDRETGQILDPSLIQYKEKSALKFIGAGEKADWKDFKAQIISHGGIAEPFLAAPPKEKGGRLAKKDNSSFTDLELEKLRDAKLTYGGVEVSWDFLNDEELQAFWALRAGFQGAVIAKKLKDKAEEEEEKRREDAAKQNADDVRKHHGGGRGGGRGGGGRGGGGNRGGRGRGGGGRGRGGGRGGDRNRERKDGGAGGNGESTGLPPSLASGGGD